MKKDMQLARRIRGDRNFDHTLENPIPYALYQLPYSNVKKEMKELQEKISQ